MSEEPLAEEIERLEERIEDLREARERSRRLTLVGQGCVVLGLVALLCILTGFVDFTPVRVIVAIALSIGGTVLMGSSNGSTAELARQLRQAERERIAAIDELNLVEVDPDDD